MKRGPGQWWQILSGISLFAVTLTSTGCQVHVAGMTLPSPYYLSDDVQYFPAGPEFKLSREAAAMKAMSSGSAEGIEGLDREERADEPAAPPAPPVVPPPAAPADAPAEAPADGEFDPAA